MSTSPSRLRRWSVLPIVVVALIATLMVAARPVAAQDGLTVSSSTTYRVDPEAGVIRVEATYTVTNVKPDRRTSRSRTQYYFTGFSTPVPEDAVNVAVTSNDRSLDFEADSFEEDGVTVPFLGIDFPRNLFYRQTRTLTVSYDLPSAELRSGLGVRVNAAHALFGAWGIGDPGAVDVRVMAPEGFEIDQFGDRLVRVGVEDGMQVFEATGIEDPAEWFTYVTFRNDDALQSSVVSTAGVDVTIRHWPGDDVWVDFVSERTRTGLPELAELIGRDWPNDSELTVIETLSPYLYGYAGWYDHDEALIEIGDDLDEHLVLHELAHGWFNDDLVESRWINEGLAEEFASLAADERLDPDRPGRVGLSTTLAPLNRWSLIGLDPDEIEARERWAYNTSWWIVRQLTDEIGVDAMSDVLDALADNRTPYPGDDEPELRTGLVTWNDFLDHLERTGGSALATDLFTEWVVTDREAERLEIRTAAIARYDELVADGDGWAAPAVVRDLMARWKFEDATTQIDDARAVLDLRDDVAAAASDLGLEPPVGPEATYEAAELAAFAEQGSEFDAVTAELERQLDVVGDVAVADARVAADRDLLTRIGLWGSEPEVDLAAVAAAFESGDLDGAEDASLALVALLDDADDLGRSRAMRAGGGLAGVLALTVLSTVLLRRRRRRRSRGDAGDAEPFDAVVADDPDVPTVDEDHDGAVLDGEVVGAG